MRNLLLLILSIFLCRYAAAQEVATPYRRSKAVYVEALGMSGFGLSLNYDMRFRKPGNEGWGFRIGAGYSVSPNTGRRLQSYYVPVMLNRVFGKGRVAFESGLGTTILLMRWRYDIGTLTGQPGYDHSVEYQLYGNIDLRLQPLRHGALFRLYWSPAIGTGGTIIPYFFGASLGVGFR